MTGIYPAQVEHHFSSLFGNGDTHKLSPHFYARKQLCFSAYHSHRNSLCPSVCHTGGSVENGAS